MNDELQHDGLSRCLRLLAEEERVRLAGSHEPQGALLAELRRRRALRLRRRVWAGAAVAAAAALAVALFLPRTSSSPSSMVAVDAKPRPETQEAGAPGIDTARTRLASRPGAPTSGLPTVVAQVPAAASRPPSKPSRPLPRRRTTGEASGGRVLASRKGPRSAAELASAGEGTETATPFYQLPEADGLPPMESGRLMRVRLPATVLRDMGMPMGMMPEGRSVRPMRADLVVGQDGLARAVRLVRE